VLRATLLTLAGVLIWAVVAGLLGQWQEGVAIAWVYLTPFSVAGYVHRRGVWAALAGFPKALRAEPADQLALLTGSLLLVPSMTAGFDAGVVPALVTCGALWFLGMLLLGSSDRLGAYFVVSPDDWKERPREAWFFDVLSAPLRSPSALATIFLTMTGVSVLMSEAWAPTCAAVVAGLVYSFLGVRQGRLRRWPGSATQASDSGTESEASLPHQTSVPERERAARQAEPHQQ
jgi:hypothetical protein